MGEREDAERKIVSLRQEAAELMPGLSAETAAGLVQAAVTFARGEAQTMDDALKQTPGVSVRDYNAMLTTYPEAARKLLNYAYVIARYELALVEGAHEKQMAERVWEMRSRAMDAILSEDVWGELVRLAQGRPDVVFVEAERPDGETVRSPVKRKVPATAQVAAVNQLMQLAGGANVIQPIWTNIQQMKEVKDRLEEDSNESDDIEARLRAEQERKDAELLRIIRSLSGGNAQFSEVTATTPDGRTISVKVDDAEVIEGSTEDVG